MSKVFKSSRVILDDKAFVLSAKIEKAVDVNETEKEMKLADLVESDHAVTTDRIIEEARREAESILNEADFEAAEKLKIAQQSSDNIVSDAYDQAKGIMEQARNKGYEEGYEAAMNASSEASKAVIEEALALKNEWLSAKETLMKETEAEIIDIILETLSKILNQKVEEDVHLVEALIGEAIKRVNKTENLTLRVSSEDYSHVLSIKPMIVAMTEKVDDIEIKQDSSLRNGSCIIDTDSGSIDSSIWTQFEQIQKIYEDLLKSE
ncbi:FliH/SctL family protein [Fusibacter sp. 3D3]|uniref:FliH/SctL family protein n=1 Tax=Fusibacter sp. 3D3 TaxID=1048380 RepID=UPI0008535B0A|nr:FliH/SctL family protein [Fusibacter sp. 3D3]GAU79877.1 flagellar assembly protein FliH [Fusibacter sp. 3D3]